MNIGKALVECRKARGITRVSLADRTGLSQVSIYNIEKGLSFPTKNTIGLLCDALGISVAYLMVYSLTENDVPEDKRDAFRVLIDPLKAFLDA